jgi:hypothetical protein
MARWAPVNGRGLDLFPQSDGELLDGIRQIEDAARRDGAQLVAILTSDIDAEEAPYLSLVLGGDESVLVFEPGDGSDLGGFSAGPQVGDTSPVDAAYGTGNAFYQRWMVIPRDAAVEAAREFFRTGARPTNVRWGDIQHDEGGDRGRCRE